MSTPKYTDEQLTDEQLRIWVARRFNRTPLEKQLAQTILDDRASLRRIREQIEPLARKINSPKANVWTRLLKEIDERL